KLAGCYVIEFFFDIGCKTIINYLIKMIVQKVGQHLAAGSRHQFTLVAASVFLYDFAFDIFIVQRQNNNFTRFALGFAFFSVAPNLNGVNNSCVGAWPADAELFEFSNQTTFGVTSWWSGKNLPGYGFNQAQAIVDFKWRQDVIFLFVGAIDF